MTSENSVFDSTEQLRAINTEQEAKIKQITSRSHKSMYRHTHVRMYIRTYTVR